MLSYVWGHFICPTLMVGYWSTYRVVKCPTLIFGRVGKCSTFFGRVGDWPTLRKYKQKLNAEFKPEA